VGRHNHPLLGPNIPAGDPNGLVHAPPHLRLGNDSDTICNDPPSTTQYCPLLSLPNQTSQEVTYPGTTLAEARLIAKFW
jgi:hypothetical protein